MGGLIRLLIADDHAVVRAGVAMLLNAEEDMMVVGEADTAEETIRKAASLKPDVILLDIHMPGGGLRAASCILRQQPTTKMVVLSIYDDATHLRAALRVGVSGYVAKRSVDTATVAAIREVHKGGLYIDPALSDIVAQDFVGQRRAGERVAAELTPRMQQVLRLAAWGYTNNEIASILSVSVKTVEAHRAAIVHRLGLSNRADLVRYAFHSGLMESPPSPVPGAE